MATCLDEAIESSAGALLDACRAARVRLGVAESCTGGLIGGALTALPGASEVFSGGVVAYENRVKEGLLGVRAETLSTEGAVSAACAEEMACGVRLALGGIEMGLASTGVAGPGGGSARKPVGTVFIAVSLGDRCAVEHLQLEGDRTAVRVEAVKRILGLARTCLQKVRDEHGQD